jgi:hypothetical protein
MPDLSLHALVSFGIPGSRLRFPSSLREFPRWWLQSFLGAQVSFVKPNPPKILPPNF